jgi:hypothetical protein
MDGADDDEREWQCDQADTKQRMMDKNVAVNTESAAALFRLEMSSICNSRHHSPAGVL